MARVLEASARQHCPAWHIDVAAMPHAPIEGGTGVSGHIANTHKLGAWRSIVDAAPDGARLALLDADMWVRRPLDAVWDAPFDVAYTVRSGWPVPFNLGAMFVRVSPAVRAFVADWAEENRRIFTGGDSTRPWRQRYGGVNQASFATLLEQGRLAALRVHALPCREWNCEDSSWATFDPDVTRVVHLKSGLRDMAFGQRPVAPELRPLIREWREIDEVVNGTRRLA